MTVPNGLRGSTDRINAVALTREHQVQGLTFIWVADAQKERTRRERDYNPANSVARVNFFRRLSRQLVPGERAHGVHVQREYVRSP